MKQHASKISGFTLLEVLIAFVILAFGMLSLTNMLLTANRLNTSSYTKQQATQAAYNIIDRMRANNASAQAGNYNMVLTASNGLTTPSPLCSANACTPTQLALYDQWNWLTSDIAQLPGGQGAISTTVSGKNTQVTVTVQWDDGPAQKNLGAANRTVTTSPNLAQFVIQTLL